MNGTVNCYRIEIPHPDGQFRNDNWLALDTSFGPAVLEFPNGDAAMERLLDAKRRFGAARLCPVMTKKQKGPMGTEF